MIDEASIPPRERIKGIVIDTNLLLLLLAGLYDQTQLNKAKVVRKYSNEDFQTLINVVAYYDRQITLTPNILTEVCNLSDKLNEETNHQFFPFVESFLVKQTEFTEPSLETIKKDNTCFYKFGIADTSIGNLAINKFLVITDDLKLYHYLNSKGLDAINYNHLRLL